MKILNVGKLTNSYVFPIKSGYVLIDTGYVNHYKSFCKELQKNNIGLNEISYIFLTHTHDDHAGFLNELLHHTNAKVIIHPKAVEDLRAGQNTFIGGCSGKRAQLFFKVMAAAGKGEHRFPPIESEYEKRFILVDHANIAELENELSAKIIETPGHTKCSISLYLDHGILFCGDAAMNGFPSSKRAAVCMDDLSDFYSSWEKIIALKPLKIYPGHGKPFSVSDLERFLPEVKSIKLLALS